VNNKLERVWLEEIMDFFEILSQDLHGGTVENCRNAPKCKAKALPT
jgi:hypothetical protein